jgi:GNAT superfamily N-acetyltransferase
MHAALGRTVTAAWGRAHLLPELHRVYDVNFLWTTGDAGGLDAAALDAEADRLLGSAGLTHRRLVLEEPAAARLTADLVARGYDAARHLYQVHEGPPPRAPRAAVHEGDVENVIPALDRYLRTDPDTTYGRHDVTRAQLLEHARIYGSAGARERAFTVRAGDDTVAWAKLWTREGVAQVEDVVCLAEHRGRGYGRDVVAAATRTALAEGAEMVFIVADARDWPKDLYHRLGYRPTGEIGVLLRQAPPTGRGRYFAGRGSRPRPPA